MKIPRRGEYTPRSAPDDFVAAEDAGRLVDRAIAALERANEVDWYEQNGTRSTKRPSPSAGSAAPSRP